eukprot:CAMPEP_0174854828 /NCGR_PEP_ID=MMETSP1114-20130205/31972_1 /TAXON_ID=312471 /ORGANISM="Neobodo designis, Strain CCAP 1951/1" /LENGTH=357 /DNA_ID=CAMNT_0016089539 /DNA_START=37 /DNA_END=1107 /DNA_ORIENTATION=-
MAHAEDFERLSCSDEEEQEEQTNQQYFDSYGTDVRVTKAMLNDKPRMAFYRDAINAANVKGKVVVDVGAGTGILSLLAARAGARRVIAIEASVMATTMRHIVHAQGGKYADVIRVVEAAAETVSRRSLEEAGHLEPGDRVDFVVSEWMGFYLLHENMLPSVIRVRDALAWRGVDGDADQTPQMIPSRAVIHAAPVDLGPMLEEECWRHWRDVEGFDMSALARMEEAVLLSANPCVHVLPPACVLHEPFVVRDLDLDTVSVADLAHIEGEGVLQWGASLRARKALESRPKATLWGVALWFDVSFADVTMPTGPDHAATHWKQTIVQVPEELQGEIAVAGLVNDADAMGVKIEMALSPA